MAALKPIKPETQKVPKSENVNRERPLDAAPVPDEILTKHGNKIGDVWWYAKGRNGPHGDPTIGVEVDGVRKTYGGYVWNDWWYFQKTVHKSEVEGEPNKCYWYRKRKVPDPYNPDDFKTEEEYVGNILIDLDTGLEVNVPMELQHEPNDLCPMD